MHFKSPFIKWYIPGDLALVKVFYTFVPVSTHVSYKFRTNFTIILKKQKKNSYWINIKLISHFNMMVTTVQLDLGGKNRSVNCFGCFGFSLINSYPVAFVLLVLCCKIWD